MIRNIRLDDGGNPHTCFMPVETEVYANEIICCSLDTTTKVNTIAEDTDLFLGISKQREATEDNEVAFVEATTNLLFDITVKDNAAPLLYGHYGINIVARGDFELDTAETAHPLFKVIRVWTATDGTKMATCRFLMNQYNQAYQLAPV
jgi:hypothetical protein